MEEIKYKVVQGKNTKNGSRWLNVGSAKKDGTRFSLVLDVLPIPNEKGEVWLMLYEREPNEVQKKGQQTSLKEDVYQRRNEG